ncbi:GPI biosynthesis protein family Pig-F-domain-containing protein, partial [Ephemerocybe angulata]
YISIVGVHTTLLSYTALFLPRTKVLQDLAGHYASDASSSSAVPTSQDRPQHPFLTALTSSPGVTLFALCAGTLILQTWWASWLRGAWVDLTVQGTEDERAREKFPEAGKKARVRSCHLANTYASVVITSLLLHVVLVLFGAPMNDLTLKTYLLALLVSILVVLPATYVLGPPTWSTSNDTALLVKRWTWVRLFAELSPRNTVERALVYPAVGTVLGAWAGIIPTALDWDRPWQAWPLTPAYGALLGYIASSILAVTLDAVISTNAANPL